VERPLAVKEVAMRAISAAVGSVALLGSAALAQGGGSPSPSLLKATFSKLPIYFIENRGVYPDPVAYYVQGADKTLFFTRDGVTFRLKGKSRAWVVKLRFIGAKRDVRPRGEERQPAVFSYFKGPEKDWKTGLTTYAKVVYEDLWPGIDLVYQGTVNRLKYEFVVKPGADPGQIRLRYEGATEVETTGTGGLRVETPAGDFQDEPPVAWQILDGEQVPVETAFRPAPPSGGIGRDFVFHVGDYDRTRALVLDPCILVYCGYLGGGGWDVGTAIAVDASENAYVAGHTDSTEQTFPVKVGPDLKYGGGTNDIFVAKVNAQGTGLVYCGYIGGSGLEWEPKVAVDRAGIAYVAGVTDSSEQTFPVKIGPDLTYNGGGSDAFVAKVNAQGTALLYCGYLGGADNDSIEGIVVGPTGEVHVAGYTWSNEKSFPVAVGPDLTQNGSWDAFVAKVNAQGTALVYCGYIGGSNMDSGRGIAVDAAGNAYVTGDTWSDRTTFPVKVGPSLTYNVGGYDAFVAKVNAAGTALVYCGYIGGWGDDVGYGVAVDAAGSAYVAGWTTSLHQTFPVAVGPDLTYNGLGDAFVARVNASGTGLDYCGYIGGQLKDWAEGIATDGVGNVYVTGGTESDETTFPVKDGPDLTYNGTRPGAPYDAFVAKVNSRGAVIVSCGYIGGSGEDVGQGIAVDAAGHAYVIGKTWSDEKTFPVKVGPDLTYGQGTYDAFVAKVEFSDHLVASGTARPGSTVSLDVSTASPSGIPYQFGTSLGTGPLPIDTRHLDLSPDALLLVSTADYWPWIFSGYRGVIDSQGRAKAAIHIPNLPALIGVRLHSASVTVDPAAPSGIRSISNTVSFSVAR